MPTMITIILLTPFSLAILAGYMLARNVKNDHH